MVVLPLEPVMERISVFKKRRQLYLTNDRDMKGARLIHLRRVGCHAGAEHDQVLAAEGGVPMATGFDIHAGIEQGRDMLRQRLCAAQVRDRDLRPAPPEEECRRKTQTPTRRREPSCL